MKGNALTVSLATIVLAGCAQGKAVRDTAQIEEEHLNAAIVQRWIGEGWAKTPGETDAVIDELFAANFELSSPPLSYQGAEAFKEHVRLGRV